MVNAMTEINPIYALQHARTLRQIYELPFPLVGPDVTDALASWHMPHGCVHQEADITIGIGAKGYLANGSLTENPAAMTVTEAMIRMERDALGNTVDDRDVHCSTWTPAFDDHALDIHCENLTDPCMRVGLVANSDPTWVVAHHRMIPIMERHGLGHLLDLDFVAEPGHLETFWETIPSGMEPPTRWTGMLARLGMMRHKMNIDLRANAEQLCAGRYSVLSAATYHCRMGGPARQGRIIFRSHVHPDKLGLKA